MLTVTVMTKEANDNHRILSEETMEAQSVRDVREGFTYHDGSVPQEGPGLHVYLPGGESVFFAAEFGKGRDRKLDVFVMNEAGTTVNRFVL